MNWFRDLRLGIKLNLVIVVAIALLALVIFILLNGTTTALIDQVGHVRIQQEISVIERHIAQAQEELEAAATLLANTSVFIEAVKANDGERIEPLILTSLSSFQFDNFDLINVEGESLVDAGEERGATDGEQEDTLLSQTLFGIQRLSVVIAEDEDATRIQYVLVRPIRDDTGRVIGGLLLARQLDDEFLTAVNLERRGVELGLIYDNQVIAASYVPDESRVGDVPDFGAVPIQSDIVRQALNANTVVNPDTAYSDAGIPNTEAYIPLQGLTDTAPQAVVVIRVENSAIAAFQRDLVGNLGWVMALLVVGVVAAVLVQVHFIVIKRIEELQKIAMRLGQGDYNQRSSVQGRDEIGKLAHTFNEMAERITQLVGDLGRQVTEAEAARARAERSDQVKSAFLASMSHELRTPLNSVINFTKFVMKGVMGPVTEKQEEALGKVVASAKHLLNLINDVLDISKIESGSLNLFVEENVDVTEILDTVKATAESLLNEKSIELQLDIEPDLPAILGDRQRILQIMLNMMSNACKFTEEGRIKISAHQRNGILEIGIQDTGPGIAPEDHAAVFEPFKQTETGLREGTGTGLGMPISKSLAEAHGGRLWIESALGQGATFYLTLPIRSEALKPVLATQPIALN